MLSTIREKTQGIIATFILLLIVIPFALWGINSYFESGSKINVAKVDDMNISQTAYRRALDRMRGRVDPKLLDSRPFKQMILDELIDRELLAHDAEAQGYRIGDVRLAQAIKELPYFQRDGQFDSALYEALLRREGMTPHDFETRLRGDGLTGQIRVGLSESGVVTAADIAQVARLLVQEREVAYAVIGLESLAAKTTVSEKDVREYYSAHADQFQTPEQVRVEYLRLSTSDLDKGVQPTEEDLKKAYADEAARYAVPEKRRASHILVSLPAQATEEQAKQALAKIEGIAKQARAGAEFAGLAKKHSEDSATVGQGGDLGEVRRGVLPKELEETIYALKSGEVSKPVRSTYGYHLVKLTAYTAEKRKAFADVRQELAEFVRKRKGEEKFFELSEKFRNLVYEQPDGLAPAAKALGLEIQKSDWFTRDGGSGVAASPKVAQAAFESEVLSQARNSDAIEISADVLVAVRVADRKPAGQKPLSEVRGQTERILKQQQAQQAARSLAEEGLQELRAGDSLESLAKKRGFRYRPPKTFTRQQTAGIDPRVAEAAFRAPRPEGDKAVYDLVDLGSQGLAVLALKRVRDPSGKVGAGVQEKARGLLTPRRGPDYYANHRAGLRQKAEIEVYADQL